MADNITTPATGTGDATPKVATDQIPVTLEHYQKIKLADGTADSTTMAAVDSHGLNVSSVASSQADGHSATLGSTTDAAATTTGSVIAQLRRIANLLAGTITATISGAVAVKSDVVTAATAAWTSATALNTALSLTVTGYSTALLSINPTTTFTGGALVFEVSDDGGTTWYPIQGTRLDSFTSELSYTIVANQTRVWQFDVSGMTSFRARLNPVITGTGTLNVRVQASDAGSEPAVAVGGTVTANAGTGTLATSSAAAAQADGHSVTLGSTTDAAATTTGSVIAQLRRIANLLAGTLGVTQSGTWTVQPGNTANSTPWLTTNTPGTSGGWSVSRLLSAATTNATSVKGSAGQVGGWYLRNAAAYDVFLKLYNKASAPTVGTDTPFMTIPVPAGAGANVEYVNGIAFGTGIAFAVTKLIADSDATAVVLNDLTVNLFYK